MTDKKEDIEQEEVKVVVEKPKTKKKAPVKKTTAKVFNVAQFCNLRAVKQLDTWVAKRFYPNGKDTKTLKEWEEIFDERKIPFKR